MERTILGRTGLSVSVMGLGCGGHSRLGLATDGTEENAVAVVRRALDLGVNFFDTAEAYGTEAVVGRALAGRPRDTFVLSTKVGPRSENGPRSGAEMTERVHGCLRRLNVEFVDVLHLHGVRAADYDHCVAELVPALFTLRDAGKIRFLGITEAFGPDPGHEMLMRAVHDDCWDVMMVGFNLLNQSARERVFPVTQTKNIGVLDMFAVRRALANPDALKELVADLARQGLLDGRDVDKDDPLGFVLEGAVAASIPDAAYRFCRYEPGIHVVLSGTGSVAHLEANAASLSAPPLPAEVTERLRRLFADIDSVSGN